ncbi:MAG: type II toxin-antitoxin system HigB family toxin [Leptospira sp.]|nr:type II toxin-antitoxin system HigB family toxin [Leptospira sp.]
MELINQTSLEKCLKEKKFLEHKQSINGIIQSFKISKLKTTQEIIEIYHSKWKVDYISPECYVFDITKKIRMILFIDLNHRTFFFYGVFTHDEYDELNLKKLAKNFTLNNKSHENKNKHNEQSKKNKK